MCVCVCVICVCDVFECSLEANVVGVFTVLLRGVWSCDACDTDIHGQGPFYRLYAEHN